MHRNPSGFRSTETHRDGYRHVAAVLKLEVTLAGITESRCQIEYELAAIE